MIKLTKKIHEGNFMFIGDICINKPVRVHMLLCDAIRKACFAIGQ